jgi:DNA-binding CsgD family transcriptional regulator
MTHPETQLQLQHDAQYAGPGAPNEGRVHEITLRLVVRPEDAANTHASAAAFAEHIGTLALTTKLKEIVRPEHQSPAEEAAEDAAHMIGILNERMAAAGLTNKERAVCRLIFLGFEQKEIAAMIQRSESRITHYLKGVYKKTGAKNRFGLVTYLIGINQDKAGRTLLAESLAEAKAETELQPVKTLEPIIAPESPLTNEERQHLVAITERMMDHYGFSAGERDVAILAMQGKSDAAICIELYMGAGTVKDHLSRIYNKLGIRKRAYIADALLGNFFSSLTISTD